MKLTRSHLYYIKKEKARRAQVISAKICRVYHNPILTAYIKMIKRHMSLNLNDKFRIKRLEELEDDCYSDYLRAVQEYRFNYGGDLYG